MQADVVKAARKNIWELSILKWDDKSIISSSDEGK